MAANWQCDNCGSVVFSGSPGPCMDCGGENFHVMTAEEERASMEEATIDPAKLARELRELHDGIRNAARENGSRLAPAFTHAMRDRIDRLCAALGVDTQSDCMWCRYGDHPAGSVCPIHEQASPVDTIEFLSDGNAIVRRGDGTEHLIGADDVPEFLLAERRKERERSLHLGGLEGL